MPGKNKPGKPQQTTSIQLDSKSSPRNSYHFAPGFFIQIDHKGIIISLSPAAANFLGLQINALFGENILKLLPGPLAKIFRKNIKKVCQTNKFIEFPIQSKGQTVAYSFHPLLDKFENTIGIAISRAIVKEPPALERKLSVTCDFLDRMNNHSDMKSLIRDFIKKVYDYTQHSLVGILPENRERFLNPSNQIAFTESFFLPEETCGVKAATCPYLRFFENNSSSPNFTAGGTLHFADTAKSNINNTFKKSVKNCGLGQYKSLAIIPVSPKQPIGFILIADFRKKAISVEKIKILENIVTHLEIAIQRVSLKATLDGLQQEHRVLVDNSLAGIYIMQNSYLLFCNQRFANIFGYAAAEELIGKHVKQFVAPQSWSLVASQIQLRESKQKEVVYYRFTGTKQDGSYILLDAQGKRIIYHKKPAILGTLLDITYRERSESALRQHADQLEALREVGLEIMAQLNLKQLFHSIVSRAMELLKGSAAQLCLYEVENDILAEVTRSGAFRTSFGTKFQIGEGFPGQVWEKGRAININYCDQGNEIIDSENPNKSIVGIPIYHETPQSNPEKYLTENSQVNDDFLGVLCVVSNRPYAFSQADIDLLNMFATQTTIAIRNVQLFEKEKKWANQLSVITQVVRKAISILEPEQLLSETIRDIHRGFGYFNVILLQLDESVNMLRRQAVAGGLAPLALDNYSQSIDEGIIGWVAKTGQSLVVNDVRVDSRYIQGFLQKVSTLSEMCVPLKLADQVLGVLDIQETRINAFDQRDLLAIETLAGQIAIAIKNARLYQDLEQELRDREAAEYALRDSEMRYRMITENTTDVIWTTDFDGKFIYVSPSIKMLQGYSPAEVVGKTPDFLLTAGSAKKIVRYFSKILKTSNQSIDNSRLESMALEFIHKNGTHGWCELSCNILRKSNRDFSVIIGVTRDITERKRAEQIQTVFFKIAQAANRTQNLRELIEIIHQQLSLIIEAPNFYVALYNNEDDTYNFPFYIDQYDDLTELSQLNLKMSLTDYVRRTGKPLLADQEIKRKLRENGEIIQIGTLSPSWLGVPLKTAKGVLGVITIQSYTQKYKYTQEDLELMTFVSENIVMAIERKQAEEALLRERDFAESLIEKAPAIVLVLDSKGKILRFNKYMEKISGYTLQEVQGKDWFLIFGSAQSRDESRALFLKNIKNDKVHDGNQILVTKAGQEREIEWHSMPLTNSNGIIIGLLTIGQDITEQLKMDKELQKAAKLESTGILAGGIAHDFNNLLTAINGNISLVKMDLEAGSDFFEILGEAEQASLRAQELTRQLLTFSKGGMPVKKVMNIDSLLKESVRFALRGSNVRCEFAIPPHLWSIEIDEGQINQVIHNLIINADQAMPSGGIIHVQAKNEIITSAGNFPLQPGKYLKISIQDNGIGIPEDHLQSIFDPYFTTKQKGSGLGLATSYSIIKNHRGYLTVESQVSVGTTFHLFLPASAGVTQLPPQNSEKPNLGTGKVLIMDDQLMVRNTLTRMLERLGYTAESVEDGAKAVECYIQHKETNTPFDVVIMDLTIPGGMGGKETIKKLLAIDPEIRAIVSSGYSNDSIMANYQKYGFRGVVIKPYNLRELGNMLEKVLSNNGL